MALTKVTTGGITDATVATADIADDAVTTAKIAAGNITATELGSDSVTGAKIAAGAVNNANKIQDSIITGAKVGSGTITDGNLATNSVTTGKIANDAVTVDKVADDAIGVAQLSASGTASSSTFLRGDNAWTAVTSTTINNNADNRLITGSGTANTLNGEAGLTWNGSLFQIDTSGVGDCFRIGTASGADTAIRVGSTGTNVDTHGVIKYDIDDNYFSFLVSGESHGSGGVYIENGGKVRLPAGVKIGGSADANLLDDYEEGTFTATAGNSVTLHSDADLCMYTKIGRQVTVRGQVRINSDNSDADFTLNGLPFANVDGTDGSSSTVGALRFWDYSLPGDTIDVVCVIDSNNSHLDFWRNRDNTSAERLDADSNAWVAFTITYFTS